MTSYKNYWIEYLSSNQQGACITEVKLYGHRNVNINYLYYIYGLVSKIKKIQMLNVRHLFFPVPIYKFVKMIPRKGRNYVIER